MKRLIALTAAAAGLSGCIDSYADRHLASPTNAITVPAEGYVSGNRAYTKGDEPAGAERVQFTSDGQTGILVCQHYWTSANETPGLVIYDEGVVIGTNVDHAYANHLCREEGHSIEAGNAPQDLQFESVYRSNDPAYTLGAARQ